MSVLDNFATWKDFLSDKIDTAQDRGMNNSTITNVAEHVGNYLSRNVEPQNDEERVLHELWSVASKEEREAISSMMVKLVQKS